MKRNLFALTLVLGLSAGIDSSVVLAADQSMSMSASMPALSASDQMFFKKAAIGGMTEVKAGQLAADKGTTDEIKLFGKKMVDDHTAAGEKLKALAASKSITLPTDLDAPHQAIIARLDKASGTAFDAAFIGAMKKGHKDAIALFEKASKSKDADIATFAKDTLPTLKEHQSTIPTMHGKM